MPNFVRPSLAMLATAILMGGCAHEDPALHMIRYVDGLPPDKRPTNWSQTRALMLRPSPAVGTVAPDFTLDTLSGDRAITRSVFQGDRPLVLIFGSYT